MTHFLAVRKCAKKADIVFVVDSSGSIGKKNFQRVRNFLVDFVNNVGRIGPHHIQVGLVKFATSVHEIIKLNGYNNKKTLIKKLRRLL
jgi:Mg-chelatase subunit ChlD